MAGRFAALGAALRAKLGPASSAVRGGGFSVASALADLVFETDFSRSSIPTRNARSGLPPPVETASQGCDELAAASRVSAWRRVFRAESELRRRLIIP